MTTLGWMDVSSLSFNSLLLLEKIQIKWLDRINIPKKELVIALSENPAVEWYFRNQCKRLNPWIDKLMKGENLKNYCDARIREAEITVMEHINDWLVYVVDPAIYDQQSFLDWDSDELREVADFTDKTVIDLGAGTGRLTFVAAEKAKSVFAVEPIGNLRDYIEDKAEKNDFSNIYTVDGLIEQIPFPEKFADIIIGGHVFGEYFDREYNEMMRVTRPGGKIILCPGNNDENNARHQFLVDKGFEWSEFLEPGDDMKRKYWKEVEK